MTPELAALIKSLILPPGFNLFLIVIAVLLLKKRNQLRMTLVIFSLTTLYLFSMPVFARFLASRIEPDTVLTVKPVADKTGKAMVILGCGRYARPPEYPGDDISACALIRLRYAAEIYPVLHLPILASGGSVFGVTIPEAVIMGRILTEKFNITPTWLEKQSRNTIENARYSTSILRENNIDTIYLVTHASHMKRSVLLFKREGFNVIPAPTYFLSAPDYSPVWLDYLPSAPALLTTYRVFDESLGILWQTVTFTLTQPNS